MACSEEALQLAVNNYAHPEQIYYVQARALRMAGRSAEADEFLYRARQNVLHVATRIQTEAFRKSWLEHVNQPPHPLREQPYGKIRLSADNLGWNVATITLCASIQEEF